MKQANATKKTKQTGKTANVVTTKAVVKQEKQIVKTTKFSHLAENVTGKDFQEVKRKANNDHKTDFGSYLRCLSRAVEFLNKNGAFEKLKFVNADEFGKTEIGKLPVNLIQYLSEYEKSRVYNADKVLYPKGKFSVYLLMNLIERYAKDKASQQIIIKK